MNLLGGVQVKDARLAILLGVYEQGWKNKEKYPSVDTSIKNWWRYATFTDELTDSNGKPSIYNLSRYRFFLDDEAPKISAKCCSIMKKSPAHSYAKRTGRKAFTAQMASESRLRSSQWMQHGCNGFDMKYPISNPMSFWTEQDVLLYIFLNKLPIASVYGDVVEDYSATGQLDGQMSLADFGLFDKGNPLLKTTGCSRTGCMYCGYGCHLEKEGEGRFERMKVTHPHLYDYIMRPLEQEIEVIDPLSGEKRKIKQSGLNYKEVIDWINEHGNLNIRY